ncbi:MAG: phosphoribosylglycinamide formyltransferase [Planctomycetaceae bacterium]
MRTLPAITDRPVRLGVLISGGGTTLQNFVNCMGDGTLNARIPLVIADQAGCGGIERAARADLPCIVLPRRDFDSTAAFSEAVFSELRRCEADLVTLSGFLSLLKIPDDFRYRVLNIHPSLIPAFCGKGYYGHRVHEAAIDRGVKISGCTVHFADNEYDHGPIILQRTAVVPDNAGADDLARLVFEQEKIAYPEAIRRVCSGRLSIDGHRTVWQPS